ncbi:hypothetical protein [Allgaiera indica]|nr:hypothetical protein [Allgaiera indica]SDX66712.1 hypothetical protein SAMN05444006_12344 [Allgaiera indica]
MKPSARPGAASPGMRRRARGAAVQAGRQNGVVPPGLGRLASSKASGATGPGLADSGAYIGQARSGLMRAGRRAFDPDGIFDPAAIVAQAIGRHHQYLDGFFLFLGAVLAPGKDRDAPGLGFIHPPGDVVTISGPDLGRQRNLVRHSTEAPEWTLGADARPRGAGPVVKGRAA